MKTQNPFALGVALLLIVAGIFFLSSGKAAPAQGPVFAPESGSEIGSGKYPRAPELAGIAGFINSQPGFSLASLRGKVVLVDFWTYSCINCIRTQPYLNAWYKKYASQGLEIVGVHTPEFDFEKKVENVQAAVTREGITYPVVLDNDYSTWRAYQNQYWPRKYLIDAQGFIRYDHIGEGGYDETEQEIQSLLRERDQSLTFGSSVSPTIDAENASTDFSQIGTPEIYVGYDKARAPLANSQVIVPETAVDFEYPEDLPPNQPAFEGKWLVKPDYLELASEEGGIMLTYTAKNMNVVASSPSEIRLTLDGNSLSHSVPINEERLYSLIEQTSYATHTVELHVFGKGFRIYTFTFG